MDPKDLFERRARRGTKPPEPGREPSGLFESVEDAVFRQSPIRISDSLPRAIEFRRKTKSWFSFPYHCLMGVEYHPHDRITVSFSTHRVTITGRNLEALYRQIRTQSCDCVTELDRATALETPEDAPEVRGIDVLELVRDD